MTHQPKLIVTGLSGLLGSALRALARGRFDLVNVDITEGIDITDEAQVQRAFDSGAGATAVIHLAAFTDVSAAHAQCGDKAGACYRVNVIGSENVARACTHTGLHLIHVSTDFIFDGRKREAYVETDRPNPIEWYGRTKLQAEEAARRSDSWTIARLAFPYASGETPKVDFVRRMHGQLAAGKPVNLFDDQIITPTYAGDIGRALLLLAEQKPAGEIFHVAGSTALAPYELGLRIAEVFELDRTLVHATSLEQYIKQDPRPRQKSLRMSNAKWSVYAAGFGLEAPMAIQEGLEAVRSAMPA